MIDITDHIAIDEREIQFDFVRASGPGGQNVNKVATAVQLRFDVRKCPGIPDDVRVRLLRLGGKRVTSEGVLIIEAKRFRTQEKNRQDALERLIELIRAATRRPKPRHRTRPSKASKERKLASKKRRAQIKKTRRPVGLELAGGSKIANKILT